MAFRTPLSPSLSPAIADLGLGGQLADQVSGETEEERKRRMQMMQQRQMVGPTSPSAAAAALLGGGMRGA